MQQLINELYPICRSITGEGLRTTLKIIQREIPLTIHEVPSGTRVFDWTVPKEWNIQGAFIKDAAGRTVLDFADSNLCVISYSVPYRGKMRLEDLKTHIFTLPDRPHWIPYRTTYYNENWGFCMPHERFLQLTDGEYEVCIDSSLKDGALTYGEFYVPGARKDEVLMSCHVCHPSLCNDNLSGIAVATGIAKYLLTAPRRYSYRVLFIPGTIGSITWLARNEDRVANVKHGWVMAGLGDRGAFTYKTSRRGNAEIDRVFSYALRQLAGRSRVIEFSPYGYDERQFCSPGFDLPVGCLMRSPFGEYPEYHTSADNLSFIDESSLSGSLELCISVINILEQNRFYLNQNPKCEPQLGKRGIYRAIGGQARAPLSDLSVLWILNLSDGAHSLLDIAERSGVPFSGIQQTADLLVQHGLLEEATADFSNK
jgi:aminopeptidase-like protein